MLAGICFGVGYALLSLAICNKLFRKKTWDGCEGKRIQARKRRKKRQAELAAKKKQTVTAE